VPPPAEAAKACEPIPDLADNKADTLANWAGEMIDRYTDCRKRHDALRQWSDVP